MGNKSLQTLKICSSTQYECFGKDAVTFDIDECMHLQRMLTALSYYQDLDLDISEDKDEFMNFCENIYVECLNDYQHILSQHSQQLETIHEKITNDKKIGLNCEYNKCKSFHRYYDSERRKVTSSSTASIDGKLLFYVELFDNIHQWLHHLFDTGMRIKKKDLNMNDIANEQDEYIDNIFSQMMQVIDTNKDKCNVGNIDVRFGSDGNQKFKLNVDKDETKEGTFIDLLFNHLQQSNIPHLTIRRLNTFLINEEYDSDSIMDDINDFQHGSNIPKAVMWNLKCINSIIDCVQEQQSMSNVYGQSFCSEMLTFI